MDFVDYYAILGVPPSASEEELRRSYRLAARRFHPDVNKSPGAASAFRDVDSAYKVLSDPHERQEYDRLWQQYKASAPALLVETFLSRRYVRPLDEPQLLYVLLKVQPVLEMSLAADAPLNVCLVVDRSTSMKGARLQHVKRAAQHIITECGAEDILSVVTFSDRAEVVIPAQPVVDAPSMKALVSTIRAGGSTSIRAGLQAGLAQVERHRHPRYVNHLILITDGRTYGDEEACLALAREAREAGIGISGMGIGEDWNDSFLDRLASITGGTSAYIGSLEAISRFLRERVRSLATAYAERSWLNVAPAVDVELDSAVRIAPSPMRLETATCPISLGALNGLAGTRVVLQFRLRTGASASGEFFVGRLDVGGEVLGSGQHKERVTLDLNVQVAPDAAQEEPPPELFDALSRLVLYRLQERAREAVESGDIAEATRKLEALATRLLEQGQEALAQRALAEARQVMRTRSLSEEGAKQLKYGTRALLPSTGDAGNDQVSELPT